MVEKIRVLLSRQIPSGHRGSLRYNFRDLVIKGAADDLRLGNVRLLISPTDNKLTRFRECMSELRKDVKGAKSDSLLEIVGCKQCPIAAIYADHALPNNFSIGSELSADDNYSAWIAANSCPAIIALLKMVNDNLITSRYAYSKLFSEAPCVCSARRNANVVVSE